jgi:hypothetical protein
MNKTLPLADVTQHRPTARKKRTARSELLTTVPFKNEVEKKQNNQTKKQKVEKQPANKYSVHHLSRITPGGLDSVSKFEVWDYKNCAELEGLDGNYKCDFCKYIV